MRFDKEERGNTGNEPPTGTGVILVLTISLDIVSRQEKRVISVRENSTYDKLSQHIRRVPKQQKERVKMWKEKQERRETKEGSNDGSWGCDGIVHTVSYRLRASGHNRRGLANLLCYHTGTAVETLSLAQA